LPRSLHPARTQDMTQQLEDLLAFLRFPSISTDSSHVGDVRACADWLVNKLTTIGLDIELHETPGHPIVIARNKHREGKKTVLIYGHYDVQPVDPIELWDTSPFEPEIRDGRIWGRGSTDNKGQMLAHVLGVEETLREHGKLPVISSSSLKEKRKSEAPAWFHSLRNTKMNFRAT